MAESTTFERICDIIRDNGGTADINSASTSFGVSFGFCV